MNSPDERLQIRIRLLVADVKQADVAGRYPMDETLFSRILNGRRPMPEGFRERVEQVVAELSGVTA
jgi:hypothetical protein